MNVHVVLSCVIRGTVMKKCIKNVHLISFVLMLLSLFLLTACTARTPEKEIASRLSSFEDACRAQDLDAVLDCYDPDISGPIREVLRFYGVKLTNLDRLLSNLLDSAQEESGQSYAELLPNLTITPEQYSFDGEDTCMVSATAEFSLSGSSIRKPVLFRCIRSDQTWYIQSISPSA